MPANSSGLPVWVVRTQSTVTTLYNSFIFTWGDPPVMIVESYNSSAHVFDVNGVAAIIPNTVTGSLPSAVSTLQPVVVLGAEKLSFGALNAVDDRLEWLPEMWIIAAKDTNHNCSSSSAVLGAFAIENLVFFILSFALSHQKTVQWVTCGCFGKSNVPDWTWSLTWLSPFLLSFVSSLVIALLVVNDDEFATSFTLGDMLLFFTTRPRSTWMTALIMLTTRCREYYISSAFSGLIAEIVLHGIALYVMGKIVHHGKKSDSISPLTLFQSYKPGNVKLIYPSALLYMVFDVLMYAILVAGGIVVAKRVMQGRWKSISSKLKKHPLYWAGPSIFCLGVMYIANWLFWTGYVQLSGDL